MKECAVDDTQESVTCQINDVNMEQLPHMTEIVIHTEIMMTMTVTMSTDLMAIDHDIKQKMTATETLMTKKYVKTNTEKK